MTRPKNFKPSQSAQAKCWRATRAKYLHAKQLLKMLQERGLMATKENVAACRAEMDSGEPEPRCDRTCETQR